ncbi:hypothetical protein CPB84DRAFT_1857840 [Gymnopilus junonius]|uniref:Uncharacterized protein n=1 Tax=Gymnopilus junonius TaxID=109634 RepID=A0A9P5TF99_GYMJU|nr:hypothetical protein CPB84DRAFT_1857840 [Gymnopilus junonius]
MEKVYEKLSKHPGLPQAIGMNMAMHFIQLVASLKRSILHAQKPGHVAEEVPNSLPDAVQEFLGSTLNLCDEYVQGCWDTFKSMIWHYDPVQHSTVANAMLFQEHRKQQNLASCSLYPPVMTCLNPSCLKDMALLHDYAKTPQKVILFTLEDGACVTN